MPNDAAAARFPALLPAILLAALLSACSGPAPAAQRQHLDGAALFAQVCAKCHGAEGGGGLPMAVGGPAPADLRKPEWQGSRTDAEVAAAIRDGRGAMPPFADVLTPEQTAALVAHVRALARQ